MGDFIEIDLWGSKPCNLYPFVTDLCPMFFKVSMRINPETAMPCGYYRLVESYRDISGEVSKKTLLSVGFLNDLSGDELCLIHFRLNERISGINTTLFSEFDSPKVQKYIEQFHSELICKKK